MQFHLHQFLKALILGLFALFFIMLHTTGDITKYINPKYDYISKIAASIFIILFLIQLFRILQKKQRHHHICSSGCDHDHNHGNGHLNLARIIGLCVMVFPLVTGFAFGPATLNSSIAANKGAFFSKVDQSNDNTNDNQSLTENAESLAEKENIDIYADENIPLPNNNILTDDEYKEKLKTLESGTIQMSEDMFSSFYGAINETPANYNGRSIKISGFVFRDEGFNSNQLVVSRFMITHCIADASILGFLTEFEETNMFPEDTWLEIEGVLDTTNFDGFEMPIIKATNWKVINEPDEPYVYPVLTLIQ
ncbi:TIGR03943 family putative permease subunit [Chryseomicrobium palamuruense]|uniref:TIGR03943 family putative permease subunit n=1 Tax=Chryseomicrobium palamuruense TaxID=682973 RepID=A0ABV8UY06_9BACL